MSWPWRALLGPGLWAVAFALIYAVHGLGCALNWPAVPGLRLNLQMDSLQGLWLFFSLAALAICFLPKPLGMAGQIIRAGDILGLGAVLLTLFPVLGLTTCGL